MKKIVAILLALLMQLAGCAPAVDDITSTPEVTDAPDVTDAQDTTPDDNGQQETDPKESTPVETNPPETDPPETEPPVKVDRFDYSIDVKEDTYVLNKDNSGDQSKKSFSTDVLIDLKSNKNSLTRYGYLKFDISSLVGDNDFTCIDLDLTLTWRQNDAGNPELAAVEVYGCETEWKGEEVTFNNQPMSFDLITSQNAISTQKITTSFAITDYVRKALANGQTEIALYLKEATPVTPLRLKFASKESGENIPKLSVYYGTKVDEQTYSGKTELGDPDLSKNGLDVILGQDKGEMLTLKAKEDTYVEAGTSADTNFGGAELIDFKAATSTINNYYRVSLIKFDISNIPESTGYAALVLNCISMENTSIPTTVHVYGCNPAQWQESSVTYNSIPDREELINTVVVKSTGNVYVDVTDYVNMCREFGEKEIAFYLEGDADSIRRLKFSSNESDKGGPVLNISNGDLAFSTYVHYKGENPWQVAMDVVSEWFDRWEEIKKGGDPDAKVLVKDPAEYTLTVDATRSGGTNGAETKYSQYKTRNIDTLKGYTANTSETKKYDVYGGFMDESMKQEATGFFYTKKIGDRWWTIDPLGYPFFRTAIVNVSMGNSAQKARTLAKYGDAANWAQAITDRLHEIGFNSTGGWSTIDTLIKSEKPLAQTQIIGLVGSYASTMGLNISQSGSTDLVGNALPVFDPDFAKYVDTKVNSTVSKYADSSDIYGWMSDNELPDETNMLDNTLAFDPTDMRFIYSYATAWTFMYMKTGKTSVSAADLTDELRKEYRAMVYDRLFSLTCKALDKYAPNHQYMGCRFLAGCYKDEYVLRVAGYWCDLITLNYYGVWEAEPNVIANIQKWAGKPFVITEWYAKGMDVWEADNRMTNKSGAGWTVRTQADRGRFYQNYALQLLECKGCVGFDWFKLWDNDPEDLTTDLSNRNANKGILSNSGDEYTELTKYMEELNNQKYNLIKYFDAR